MRLASINLMNLSQSYKCLVAKNYDVVHNDGNDHDEDYDDMAREKNSHDSYKKVCMPQCSRLDQITFKLCLIYR